MANAIHGFFFVNPYYFKLSFYPTSMADNSFFEMGCTKWSIRLLRNMTINLLIGWTRSWSFLFDWKILTSFSSMALDIQEVFDEWNSSITK